MKKYKCLYNEDMGCIGLVATPECPSNDYPVTRAHVERFVHDIENTAVDAFFCCPVDLRAPFWHSKTRPIWEEDRLKFKAVQGKMTSSQLNIHRTRDYILSGGDPVIETYNAVKNAGIDFFFSLRMNDWHYVNEANADNAIDYPTVDRFFIDHPEYKIGNLNSSNPVGWKRMNPHQQNYLVPEVREHYLSLVSELINLCDIDGFELDFMRSPNYFPEDKIVEGTQVMTDFIRQVRKLLDEAGKTRNKFIPLCLHMPHKYEYCAAIGFDLETLVEEGTVQMVVATSSYFHNESIDIEGFKRHLPKAQVYGEIQEIICKNVIDGAQIERKMTTELFRSTAQSILHRGADGISIYNYQFFRPMIYDNPQLPDEEISKETLVGITDLDYLKNCDKLYVVSEYGQSTNVLASSGNTTIHMAVNEDEKARHSGSILRLSFKTDIDEKKISVYFNGTVLDIDSDNKELFEAKSKNGLLPSNRTRNYVVPLNIIKLDNAIEVLMDNDTVLTAVELALYK
ncbi:MAG: hypothetical protein MJ236_00635 [Clostridia bacterium]|nr:hypothetical protein [Clostridia bacterium]